MEENPAKKYPIGSHHNQLQNIPTTITTTTLPDHIVMEEILPRVPVKSLFRFKCVSKHWLFTISTSPDFSKLYLKFSSLLRRHFLCTDLLSRGLRCKFYLLPYQTCSTKNDMVELGCRDDAIDRNVLVDSCNGLVCLYYEGERECYFTLWNPATRQSIVIKSPPGVHLAWSFGFGYVPSLDDYQILVVFASEWQDTCKFRGLYVFSLRSGQWDRVIRGDSEDSSRYGGTWRPIRGRSDDEIEKERIVDKLSRKGLMIGDTSYWPTYPWFYGRHIIGFDLLRESLVEYPSLDWQAKHNEVKLFRLKGCLGFYGYYGFSGCEFWMLKDVNDWNSWQKLFSLDQAKVAFITISETGKCLVQESEQLKLVNLSMEDLGCIGEYVYRPAGEKAVDHVDSLISPFGMNKSVE